MELSLYTLKGLFHLYDKNKSVIAKNELGMSMQFNVVSTLRMNFFRYYLLFTNSEGGNY